MSVSADGDGCPSCGAPNPTAPVPVEEGTVLLCEGCAVAHMSDQLDADELAALSAEVRA